jgi:hypothetical protein
MALSDLAVFSEYTYEAATQVVAQQVALFNEAAQGTFILRAANHTGDFSDFAFWKRLQGLVRRRNAYGTGAIPQINFAMLTENMVKIAAGTPEVRLDPGQFRWINQDPATRGVEMGQQLGQDMVRDMFNTGLGALVASHSQYPSLIVDKTTVGDGTMDMSYFNAAQALYGDRWRDLQAWVMHSQPMFKLWDNVFKNAERLFQFENLNVMRDPFGRPFIVSDAPGLVIPATTGTGAHGVQYWTLGVKPGAVVVDQNDDFDDNFSKLNGQENLVASYQAEWSYNVGIRAHSWDKTNGGKSPTDAALLAATNWDRTAGYNDRDLACVMLKTA